LSILNFQMFVSFVRVTNEEVKKRGGEEGGKRESYGVLG